ncbi:hypothetical protein MKK84_14495 [Methylobacterium sp. E-065]|uniref:hypothetical protein n=1 Tax=Methylobacterium sp. E-065 TaxID=2836583 RepID=UPI001FB8EF7D|nr:hypothetical protein [Methylobacterium sp. E-065]MCJ2018632.1 hypothetical protein [Methylobacterium sp. E-065]
MDPIDTSGLVDDTMTAKNDVAKDQWANVIRVQIHFNELIQRVRQLTSTLTIAAFGSAAAFFGSHPHTAINVDTHVKFSMHVSTLLIIAGFMFLFVGYLTDRQYYFKLLLASVQVGMDLEKDHQLPAQLTTKLSAAVSPRVAKFTVTLFYISALLVGIALIWLVNFATISNLDVPHQ